MGERVGEREGKGKEGERVGRKIRKERWGKVASFEDSLSPLRTSWLILTHGKIFIVKLDRFIGLQWNGLCSFFLQLLDCSEQISPAWGMKVIIPQNKKLLHFRIYVSLVPGIPGTRVKECMCSWRGWLIHRSHGISNCGTGILNVRPGKLDLQLSISVRLIWDLLPQLSLLPF